MKHVLMLLMLTHFVMGQTATTHQDAQDIFAGQKACHNEAEKQHKPGVNTVRNHFDSKTTTCWIRVDESNPKERRMFITVGNAFELQSTAMYIGSLVGEPIRPGVDTCVVDDIQCHSDEEFFKLLKSHYPGL
jgi:hypothetical protein